MYCRNCGKQNPEGAKFCSGCGSALTAVHADRKSPVQEYAPVHRVSSVIKETPSGKHSGGLKKYIISVLVFAVVFACSYVASSWVNDLPDVEPSLEQPRSGFATVFWICGLPVPQSDFAGQGVKTVSYVIDRGEQMLETLEFVYEDGIALVMVDTIYVPVDGLDVASKTELNTMMYSNLRTYTALSFCQLSSYEENNYYVYKLIFTDLNERENVIQLSSTGLISLPAGESKVDQIGIKITEDELLNGGYVKR